MDANEAKAPVGRPWLGPNAASHAAISAALTVHATIGAGMLERTVRACRLRELRENGLQAQHHVHLPLEYKGVRLPAAYRIDFIVDHCLILEIKCVEKLLPVHGAQLLCYLRLTDLKLDLLMNFNVRHLRQAIRRIVNGLESDPSTSSAASAVDRLEKRGL